MLQPECALPILSWYDDMKDRCLLDLIHLLIELTKVDDVRHAIPRFVRNNIIEMPLAFRVISSLLQKTTKPEDSPIIRHENSLTHDKKKPKRPKTNSL